MAKKAPPLTSRGGRLALALAPLLLAGLGELAARSAKSPPPLILDRVSPLFEKFMSDLNADFFRTEKDGAASVAVVNRLVDVQRATRFPVHKTRGVFRVFCVGESTVALGQFTRFLEVYLQVVKPDVRFEVINAGQGFIDPPRVLRVFRETLRYEPDLIVVYMGHNFTHEIPDLSPWRYHALRAAERSALLRWAVHAARRPGSRRTLAPDAPLERLRASLAEMSRLARGAGVPLIACVPAGNLLQPPAALPSGWGDSARRAELGAALLDSERGDFSRAERRYLALRKASPEIALFPFQLGLLARRLGRVRQARALLETARDLDRGGGRATTEVLRAVRTVSREEHLIADVERQFAGVARDGLPGFDLFVDNCHPHPSAYGHVVRPILRAMESAGAPAGPWRWAALARAETALAVKATGAARTPRSDMQMLFNSALLAGLRVTFNGGGFSEECVRYFQEALRVRPALFSGMLEASRDADALRRVLSYTQIDDARIHDAWAFSMAHAAAALRREGRAVQARRLLESLLKDEASPAPRALAAVQLAVTAQILGDGAGRERWLEHARSLGTADDPYALALRPERR